ncbi:type II toxin-antitoxin system RelE/ParE family toxin, partial [Bradyrhizobium sp.]|uniref:type II toxin-antitoxin system RelE/ParE family toxin n=1 Tax=Bradyrhizobium sp. TaxID=376 RepID=UPI003C753459
MAEYRLTDRARADLIDIYDFTESKFGAYQADAYYTGLVRSFGLLADFPLIGQPVDELAAGYRRFRFQSHLIFYTVQPHWVEIRAVVH